MRVRGLIIDQNNRILLGLNKDDAYVVPGGKLREKENPEDGLLREIKEETGLTEFDLISHVFDLEDNRVYLMSPLSSSLPTYGNDPDSEFNSLSWFELGALPDLEDWSEDIVYRFLRILQKEEKEALKLHHQITAGRIDILVDGKKVYELEDDTIWQVLPKIAQEQAKGKKVSYKQVLDDGSVIDQTPQAMPDSIASLKDWSGIWVHYTDINKLGVHPKQFHQDPAGIYLFPEEFKTGGTLWRKKAYKYTVRIKPNAKILDVAELKKSNFIALLDKLNIPGDYFITEDIKVFRDFWDVLKNYYILTTNAKGAGFWNKELRRIGYDAIFDDLQEIHSAEIQLIVLDPKIIEVIDVERQSPKKGQYDSIKNITDILAKALRLYGKVTVEPVKKRKEGLMTPKKILKGQLKVVVPQGYMEFEVMDDGNRYWLVMSDTDIASLKDNWGSIHAGYRSEVIEYRDFEADKSQKIITDHLKHVMKAIEKEKANAAWEDGKWVDQLPGGKADNRSPDEFDPEQIKKGIDVELEHTDSEEIATEISMDHLVEDEEEELEEPYYDRLETIEPQHKAKGIKRNDKNGKNSKNNIDNIDKYIGDDNAPKVIEIDSVPANVMQDAIIEITKDGELYKRCNGLKDYFDVINDALSLKDAGHKIEYCQCLETGEKVSFTPQVMPDYLVKAENGSPERAKQAKKIYNIIDELLEKYIPEQQNRPSIEILDGIDYFAKTVWRKLGGDNGTLIAVNRNILDDDDLLRQVLAHEVIHHHIYQKYGNEAAKHGEIFHMIADKINNEEGSNFVTKYANDTDFRENVK